MFADEGFSGAPKPRMGPGFSSLNGMLYVFGGQTIQGEFALFKSCWMSGMEPFERNIFSYLQINI